MKFLCYLFSLMVFVMSFMPCADTFAETSKKDSAVNHNSSSPEDHMNDLCSPFCQCTCCTTPAATKISVFSILLPVSAEFELGEHIPGDVRNTPISVWQPPKLAYFLSF
ncbi:hypothetical protein BDE36_1720 [Arcticibacter tournemirensis]|nr:DUF6660 family protein [Arcticibacter tournemirensis]TQM49986.1 hypothetical protein BDE36_1720 [Arcticibacter tournemirensis]